MSIWFGTTIEEVLKVLKIESTESFNSEVMFNNKTVHKQVSIFDETIEYIFKLSPNRLVTFDDRNLLWMNDFVKNKI